MPRRVCDFSTERCLCRAHSYSSTPRHARTSLRFRAPVPAAPRGFSHSPERSQAAPGCTECGGPRPRPGRAGRGGAGTGRAKGVRAGPPWLRERFLRRSEGPVRRPPGSGGRVGRRSGGHADRLNRLGPQKASVRQQPPGPAGRRPPFPPAGGCRRGPARTAGPAGRLRTAGAPAEVKARAPLVDARGEQDRSVVPELGRGSRLRPPPPPPHSHLGRSAGRWQLTAGSPRRRHRGSRLTSPRSALVRGVPARTPPAGHAPRLAARCADRQGARAGTACRMWGSPAQRPGSL